MDVRFDGHNYSYCPVTRSYKRIYLTVTYSVEFLFGLALNATLLWLIHSRMRRRSCSVVYLSNLAVADLLYVWTLPLLIVTYAMDDVWPFGDATCKLVRFLFYTSLHGSMVFLTCISVHRFLGVRYPISTMRFRRKNVATLVSCFLWVLVTIEIFPVLFYVHSGFINNMTVCFDITSPGHFKQYFPYGMFLTIVGFLIPFLIILICNCSMMRTLSRRNGESARVGSAMRSQSVRTLRAVCLLFVMCFGPYHITRTIYLFVRVYLPWHCEVLNLSMLCYKIWRPLVSFNCCANPILYFLTSNRRRRQLWEFLRRRKVHPQVWTLKPNADLTDQTGSD